MNNFHIEKWDGDLVLVIRMKPFNEQILDAYPQYDPNKSAWGICTDYRLSNNVCGHTQRAFIQYWALRSFIETGLIGVELGSAGVVAPMCISTDIVGNGERPEYGGIMSGVQIKLNAANLDIFQTASLSCVLSNHLIEHLKCDKLLEGLESAECKKKIGCNGSELLEVIRDQWLRVIVSGGYLAFIFPEEGAANAGGHSVFNHDSSHQHAWFADRFRADIIQPLIDDNLVDLIEYDTFQNYFSTNLVLKKK